MEEGLTPSHSLRIGQSACGYMPIINKQYTVSLEDNNPAAIALNDLVHLDRELSQHYGKNIRQGMNFRVKGVQVAMRGANSGYDVGLASAVRLFPSGLNHGNQSFRTSTEE